MNKHHKITALERDQIAWWLASGVTIREMVRRLGRSPSSISANGLLRRYFPKGTDFPVSQGAVNEVVARLNSTPRKVLGYQTPLEVFTALC